MNFFSHAETTTFPPFSHLELCLLCVPHHRLLLAALLTDLIGAVPFTLDGPRSEALMIGIVASSMAVLDEATTSMAAVKVDDFELNSFVSSYLEILDKIVDLLGTCCTVQEVGLNRICGRALGGLRMCYQYGVVHELH